MILKFKKYIPHLIIIALLVVVIALIIAHMITAAHAAALQETVEQYESQIETYETQLTVKDSMYQYVRDQYLELLDTQETEVEVVETTVETQEEVIETEPETVEVEVVTETPEVEYIPEPVYEPIQTTDWEVPIVLTPEERDAFAALIMLESQGESMECKMAVASVVLNRMINDNRTLYEVLYADNQFEPAPYIASTVGNEDCYAAVDYVLANGPTIPRYVTYFATYYFGFATPYTVIDHTYFSYTQVEWNKVNN